MRSTKAIKWISVITVVLMFVLTIVLVFEFVKINELKTKQNALNTSVKNLEKDIADYKNSNDYLKSEEFVEDFARENLGWGVDGEIKFES